MDYSYVDDFKKLGFGLFNHFGLYSVMAKGEWYLKASSQHPNQQDYEKLINRFVISPSWAKQLVSLAKKAGCKYITLTTRHHEGFSLYDTRGLNTFDAPHSATHRDLIKEFADECHKQGIVPVFYHTVIDWHNEDFLNNRFDAYFDYLKKSIEILCKNYGEVGGFWFDGTWGLPKGVSFPREIYTMIHQLQPRAIITNNTGLDALGQQGAEEIDCVTFERGKPFPIESSARPLAGEVCTGITDHWGYAPDDICLKPAKELISLLVECRANGCNLLLNTGLKGNGLLDEGDKAMLLGVGKWIKANKKIIYNLVPTGIEATNATILTDGKYDYALINDVPMCLNTNVTRMAETKHVILKTDKKITNAIWLDNKAPVTLNDDGSFNALPFDYGTSLGTRVARFVLK